MEKKVWIAVDFDGTIVHEDYPRIGNPLPLAFRTLSRWQRTGLYLILHTMRTGELLEKALKFCRQNGIVFDAVNENPEQKDWPDPSSGKVWADIYIDDHMLGAPLDHNGDLDWSGIEARIYNELSFRDGLVVPF
jgi:hypothetical protein